MGQTACKEVAIDFKENAFLVHSLISCGCDLCQELESVPKPSRHQGASASLRKLPPDHEEQPVLRKLCAGQTSFAESNELEYWKQAAADKVALHGGGGGDGGPKREAGLSNPHLDCPMGSWTVQLDNNIILCSY